MQNERVFLLTHVLAAWESRELFVFDRGLASDRRRDLFIGDVLTDSTSPSTECEFAVLAIFAQFHRLVRLLQAIRSRIFQLTQLAVKIPQGKVRDP